MSAMALNIDPIDANWRVLQAGTDKPFTARAVSRERTEKKRRHGSKSYDREKDDTYKPNPHTHLSVVASALRLPEADASAIAEPISLEADPFDEEVDALAMPIEADSMRWYADDVARELIGGQMPERMTMETLPEHFHLTRAEHEFVTETPRHEVRRQLCVPSDYELDFDPTDHDQLYLLRDPLPLH